MCVALTLWFLATGADYRTISHLFGVSKSTVRLVSKGVCSACSAIVKSLLPHYIRFPAETALRDIMDGFKCELGFPQCAEAVDGSHIPIMSPLSSGVSTTGKAGTPLSFKAPPTIEAILQMCTWAGQVKFTMLVFSPTLVYIKWERAVTFC